MPRRSARIGAWAMPLFGLTPRVFWCNSIEQTLSNPRSAILLTNRRQFSLKFRRVDSVSKSFDTINHDDRDVILVAPQ